MKKVALIPVLFATIALAAPDSVIVEQRTLLNNLQQMDFSNPGVLLTGEFRSNIGFFTLDRSGSGTTDGSVKNTDVHAATEADIELQARPTKETRATALFRIHQDWQKSHEEGVSPFLFDWLSYDGKAVDGIVDFNMGDMSIKYTPLTIYAPLLNLSNEPELLALRRKDVMNYMHLKDDGGRLMQGVNFVLNSGAYSVFDNFYLQGTASRLRSQAKKFDQVFFDFDWTDRFLFAGRGGFGLFGVDLGVGYVYTFTRENSLKNLGDKFPESSNPFLVEDNGVLSANLGVDIARLAGLEGYKLSLGAEYAKSNYKTKNFYAEKKSVKEYKQDSSIVEINGVQQIVSVVTFANRQVTTFRTEDLQDIDGSAILVNLNFALPASVVNLAGSLKLVQNDKDFVSELAQSPVYYTPSAVLNASAVDGLRIGATLENLYFAKYTNDPLTMHNIVYNKGVPDETNTLNNNKKAHFLRSGYRNGVFTPNELRSISPYELDPGVNLALPFGLATPDRSGFLLNLDMALLDNKLGLNAYASRVAQNESIADLAAPVYLDLGGGASVEIAPFVGYSKPIRLNAGFGTSTETDGYERSATKASAGLRFGLWRELSLLCAFQMVNKNYGKLFEAETSGAEVTGNELLWLAGPEIKISEGSYFNIQYGMLNYEYKVGDNSAKLDRSLFTADVRIKF